jgi:hypothetical protein
MINILLVILLGLLLVLIYELKREQRRNRILQSFIAGIIRCISDYKSRTDDITADDISIMYSKKLPIPYKDILENINYEFAKDFWIKPFGKWLKNDRNIFCDEKYADDGFNMIYWDLYDHVVAEMKNDNDTGKNNSHQS